MADICLNKKVLELDREVQADLRITEINVKEKAMQSSSLKCKWFVTYLSEKKKLEALQDKRKEVIDEYVKEHGKVDVLKVKTQNEATKQEQIKTIDKALKIQCEVVEYLEGVYKIWTTFSYDVKNSIDIIKIEVS